MSHRALRVCSWVPLHWHFGVFTSCPSDGESPTSCFFTHQMKFPFPEANDVVLAPPTACCGVDGERVNSRCCRGSVGGANATLQTGPRREPRHRPPAEEATRGRSLAAARGRSLAAARWAEWAEPSPPPEERLPARGGRRSATGRPLWGRRPLVARGGTAGGSRPRWRAEG